MDGERRRRVAERFAMDDLPCGRATGASGTASEDGTRAQVPGRSLKGREGAFEGLGEVSGGGRHGGRRRDGQ